MAIFGFFEFSTYYTGPRLTDAMVLSAEEKMGYSLPKSYLRLLREKNGGRPRRQCFPADDRWADSHVRVETLFGIGGSWGIDSEQFGSRHLIQQAGLPEIGIVVALTPTAGHDAIMLDYSASGSQGEPRITYVAPEDSRIDVIAQDFESFIGGLVNCRPYNRARERELKEYRRRSQNG